MRTFARLSILLLSFFLVGCSFFADLSNDSSIDVLFNENDTIARSITNQNEELQGMYFGELEVVAYQYSPGFTDTSGFGNGEDWAYYVVLQSGHEAARDILLKSNGNVDISALNDSYDFNLENDFTANYDSFSIDFLEVNIYRTGVILNNKYFGMNADFNGLDSHPLHKYPEFLNIQDFWRDTNIDGFPENEQSFSVFFARSDWFPEPVLVNLTEGDEFQYSWSSSPLSNTQKELLESLATNGTGRRFYGNLVIVPYEGPVKFAATSKGEGMEEPVAVINFNFDTLLSDQTYNDFSDNGFINNSTILYRLVDDIPFGLSIDFIDQSLK